MASVKIRLDRGSHLIDSQTWKELSDHLAGALDTKQRAAIVDAFLARHVVPQPGDFVLFERHAMLVDHWDEETRTIITIEGNAGNAVRAADFR